MSEKTGSSLTFFYGDKRLVTSLKDKKGDYILGSKAGDYLKKNVLEGGKECIYKSCQRRGDYVLWLLHPSKAK